MKTMILWVAKGCRKPKMIGTATAVCSAAKIENMRRSAREGRGKLFIVDGKTAAAARDSIKAFRDGTLREAMTAVLDGERTVCIGTKAVMAVSGAREACRNWDARIATQGRVTERQSKALTGDDDADLARLSLGNLFG